MPNTGISFMRTGIAGQPDREIRRRRSRGDRDRIRDRARGSYGPLCSTAEHVLAALSGLGVDNALIEIDGPEVPIMDGSAAAFVAAIEQAGIVTLAAPRRYIQILKPVSGRPAATAFGELRPYPRGFRLEVEIAFDNALIGRQNIALDVDA